MGGGESKGTKKLEKPPLEGVTSVNATVVRMKDATWKHLLQ